MNDSDKVIKALKAHGWTFIHQAGSHQKWLGPDGKRICVVPCPQKDFPAGTKSSIEKQAGFKIF